MVQEQCRFETINLVLTIDIPMALYKPFNTFLSISMVTTMKILINQQWITMIDSVKNTKLFFP